MTIKEKVQELLDPAAREQAKIERRVRKSTTTLLLDWSDLAADGIARHLSAWRRKESREDLDEAALNARVLTAALAELQRRAS